MTSTWSLIFKKRFAKDLYNEISDDNVFNGAAALAYYLLFALFPAMIFLLSLLPYLPIENLHGAVMDALRQAMPGEAAKTVEGTIAEITTQKRGGLLSVGALLTLWAASSGLYAIMQQLNITYDVKESRPFWKARGTAIVLTIFFALLVIGAFALIIFGGVMQDFLGNHFGLSGPILFLFATFRWLVIALLLLAGFSLTYYYGPDVKQDFKFITPGSMIGFFVLVVASLAFRFYVENFGDYAATYGSLGAVIILMLWLYIAGLVILLGSEVNALVEHYSPQGKNKGERAPHAPANARGRKNWVWEMASPRGSASAAAPHPAMMASMAETQKSWMGRNYDLVLALVALALATRGSKSR